MLKLWTEVCLLRFAYLSVIVSNVPTALVFLYGTTHDNGVRKHGARSRDFANPVNTVSIDGEPCSVVR